MNLDPRLNYSATRLRVGWVIRPAGALGTCGWVDGVPWQAVYVKHKPARIPEEP